MVELHISELESLSLVKMGLDFCKVWVIEQVAFLDLLPLLFIP